MDRSMQGTPRRSRFGIAFVMKFSGWNRPFLVFDHSCTTPDGKCTEIELVFVEDHGDEGLNRDPLAVVRIDRPNWSIVNAVCEIPGFDPALFLEELQREIQEKHKDVLLKRDHDIRTYGDYLAPSAKKHRWTRNEMTTYINVFLSREQDRFFLDSEDGRYFVTDSYCTKPDCACKEVILSFCRQHPRTKKFNPTFALSVNLGTRTYKVLDNFFGGSTAEIASLYERFLTALGDEKLGILKERHNRLKKMHRLLVGPSSVPKIGRNEICPCGSGKKYKVCCQGK